jgi:hypothetical protein
MLTRWSVLSCMLFLGLAGISQAHPLDSPNIVYIDGQPCNNLCQSYLAWSREVSSRSARYAPAKSRYQPPDPARLSPNAVVHRTTRFSVEKSRPAAHVHLAKQPASNFKDKETSPAKLANLQPAAKTAGDSDATQAEIVESHPAAGAIVNSDTRTIQTIQKQVAAAVGVAERMTVAIATPASESKKDDTEGSDHSAPVTPGDNEKAATALPNGTDLLVALLMVRPEIKPVSELANKNIAIDDSQSAPNGDVRTAIVAAGAPEVQLTAGETKAIDRLISGEVPAAVLALVSPEAAAGFPDIPGFKIIRVPLSPTSLKARL